MNLNAESWPIIAAPLQFPSVTRDGTSTQEADPEQWRSVVREIGDAGFNGMELTDSWLRIGDLSESRIEELKDVLTEERMVAPSATVVRASIIDRKHGARNLAYAHRAIDAAAQMGCTVIGTGLHQVLTEEQRSRLWFWTAAGYLDPADEETRAVAVARFTELGRHAAEVGLLLSLELYEDTFFGSAAESVRMIEEIGLSTVGLNPDIGNLVRLHRPVEDWREIAEKTLPYANYWHVKNYLRDEDPATETFVSLPAPLENGFINYREVLKDATAAGFQGIICLENYGGDGLSVCATNQEYLRRRVLPKSGDYSLGTSLVQQSHSSQVSELDLDRIL